MAGWGPRRPNGPGLMLKKDPFIKWAGPGNREDLRVRSRYQKPGPNPTHCHSYRQASHRIFPAEITVAKTSLDRQSGTEPRI